MRLLPLLYTIYRWLDRIILSLIFTAFLLSFYLFWLFALVNKLNLYELPLAPVEWPFIILIGVGLVPATLAYWWLLRRWLRLARVAWANQRQGAVLEK